MLSREVRVATAAILKASKLASIVAGQPFEAFTKSDKSPLTLADLGVQVIINHEINSHFPLDGIVAEEDSSDMGALPGLIPLLAQVDSSPRDLESIRRDLDLGRHQGGKGRFWTLDPIGFLRKQQYAICLALIVDGVPQLALLSCPNLKFDGSSVGSIFVATRGNGAFMRSFSDETLVKISATSVLKASETLLCESVEASHSAHDEVSIISKSLGIFRDSVRMDSQCKYGVVARGEAGIYLRIPTSATYQEKIWDHAAGSLIVEEAGGVVTDLLGKPLDFSQGRTLKNNTGILAAGANIHKEILDAIRLVKT